MTDRSRVDLLPVSVGDLASGVPQAPVGTLFLMAAKGGLVAPPKYGFPLLFGRNEPDVHLCVGAGDPCVSRCHGRLTCYGTEWWIRNEGRLPIRLPRSNLLVEGAEVPLEPGYSPLFIRTGPRVEHLLEVWVVGGTADRPRAEPHDPTGPRQAWKLEPAERLVLTSLAQRYLRQEEYAQPLSWNQVSEELNALSGSARWTPHRAANVVERVRAALSGKEVRGLTRDEVGEPVGNALNHNLIVELLETTTLTPRDLALLNEDG
ncbi:FHA domain-containing protein [Nonomuraea diastatica]|uniref:FHA domain-containing protein n=1 Tax=Nonomuraea diastatica TaxID=1848329 RepID=A0A4R4WW90_9ACTN|nr:FHA domain-containing protein [Nonomuraea diastatica]TDD22006.1 FHA domain-containing protein [Nonomuraea diastatica]